VEEKRSIIKSILKVLIPVSVVGLIVLGVYLLVPEAEEPVVVEVRGGEELKGLATLENDNLLFTMDKKTSTFTLLDKETGTTWCSNPSDADTDPVAQTLDKKANMKSTMYITYGNINGIKTTYNNYQYSIEKGIFEIEEKEDSIRVLYTVGNTQKEYKIPLAMDEKKFNALCKKMEKKVSKQIKEYYRKTDINNLRATDNKEELLKSYPELASKKLYIMRDNVANHLKATIETAFYAAGYTEEDYLEDISKYSTTQVLDIPLFNITVEYKLDGRDLIVSVPMEEIEYKPDFPLINIEMLPYFGAGNSEDNGFMIVPESGGAVINFNNGRSAQNPYYANVYGWDYGQSRKAVVTETRNTFPVFGLSKNNSSFLCFIEGGASYANINADVSGRFDNYNHVDAGYSIAHYESFDVSGKSDSSFYVYEEELPKETISQRYRFTECDDYSSLAGVYRDYLLDKYPDLGSKKGDVMPQVIEVIQAIDKVQQTMGVPYSQPLAITSYDETVEISDELDELGIKDYAMKLTGFMNGGVKHSVLKDIDLISKLGGKSDFKDMIKAFNDKNIKVYLEGQTDYAYEKGLFDGFVSFRDAAKFASREEAELYDYSYVWYGQMDFNDSYYLVKPSYSKECFEELLEFAREYNAGVAPRYTGYQLNSDYNPKDRVSRQEALGISVEMLENASADGVIINEGNEYAIPYVDVITGMDISNSNIAIIDYDIPFYEMAIHGLVDYTGVAINLSEDYEYELLKTAEFGAGLYFTFMKAKPDMIQETFYSEYYGASFDLWKEKMAQISLRYKNDFDPLSRLTMVNHEVDGNIRITEYEDGTKVYVNYSYSDIERDGVIIPARDYAVKRGESR